MTTQTTTRSKTYDMVYVAVFAVLIAICSWISIPMTVPFTLQTFAVFLAVGVLGGKRGSLAVLIYILLGAVGIPVFAGFSGGIGQLLGNTGGYIIGFLFSALLMWLIEKLFGRKTWVLGISMVLGSDRVLCYRNGVVHGCICAEFRSCRSGYRTGLVCNSFHHSGSGEDRTGTDTEQETV